jgi:hypothetical protein
MGNAFDRQQQRINDQRAKREAAMTADLSTVRKLPTSRYQQPTLKLSYEQGVRDGVAGTNAIQRGADERQFGAYLDGIKAGSRARLSKVRREAAAAGRIIPQRPVPTKAEVAAELAERTAVDEARKARRRDSGILAELREACNPTPITPF